MMQVYRPFPFWNRSSLSNHFVKWYQTFFFWDRRINVILIVGVQPESCRQLWNAYYFWDRRADCELWIVGLGWTWRERGPFPRFQTRIKFKSHLFAMVNHANTNSKCLYLGVSWGSRSPGDTWWRTHTVVLTSPISSSTLAERRVRAEFVCYQISPKGRPGKVMNRQYVDF